MMQQQNEDRIREDHADVQVDHQYHHHDLDHDLSATPSLSKSCSFAGVGSFAGSFMEQTSWEIKAEDARPLLPKAAFFMGDLRDGLPMVRTDCTALHCTVQLVHKQQIYDVPISKLKLSKGNPLTMYFRFHFLLVLVVCS